MTRVLLCTPFEQDAGFVSGGINVWGNAVVSFARKQYSLQPGTEVVPVSFDRRFYVNESTSLFQRIVTGMRDYLRPVRKVLSYLRKDSFDVLHLCSSAHLGLLRDLCVIRMAHRHGVRTVVHFHFGRIPDILAEGGWERVLLRKVCRKVDSIVVMDIRSYNALRSEGLGNVSYIPNPLSEKVVSEVDEKMSGGLQRIQGKVLFAGHVVETKGVFELVRACCNIDGVQLHMAGKVSDAMKRSLEDAAQSREDGKWLHVRGEMPHEKVIEEMLSSQVFVLPSYTEGFPNVILESMACGCAIVSTPVGAIPEMLQFKDKLPCGLCVPVKDEKQLAGAISSLCEDSSLSSELGLRASSRVRSEYSIRTVWSQLVNVWAKPESMERCLFELIQSALGLKDSLSVTVSAENWRKLHDMAAGQSLLGVTFFGLSRMYDSDGTSDAWNSNRDRGLAELPVELFYEWMNDAYVIQNTNARFNSRCLELQESVSSKGLRNFIMKGQGNATLYGDLAMLRQSGDIDLYVEGGYRKVVEFVNSVRPTDRINELEIQYEVFDDTSVEIHFRPFVLRNPFKNRKLQKFFKKESEFCFGNRVPLPGGEGEITASTIKFSLVHQIVHIFHHLFTEGIGLRQLMDYYYLLVNASADDMHTVRKEVRALGMERFASALMSVLKWTFCLESSRMPWPENEKDGRFLLDAVMKSGNFGRGDNSSSRLYDSRWASFWTVNGKAFRYARFDRWMWFWSPVWRISHYVWRKINDYR